MEDNREGLNKTTIEKLSVLLGERTKNKDDRAVRFRDLNGVLDQAATLARNISAGVIRLINRETYSPDITNKLRVVGHAVVTDGTATFSSIVDGFSTGSRIAEGEYSFPFETERASAGMITSWSLNESGSLSAAVIPAVDAVTVFVTDNAGLPADCAFSLIVWEPVA